MANDPQSIHSFFYKRDFPGVFRSESLDGSAHVIFRDGISLEVATATPILDGSPDLTVSLKSGEGQGYLSFEGTSQKIVSEKNPAFPPETFLEYLKAAYEFTQQNTSGRKGSKWIMSNPGFYRVMGIEVKPLMNHLEKLVTGYTPK